MLRWLLIFLGYESPLRVAVSTDRRNTLIELLSWRDVIQGHSWPLVEFPGYRVEMLLTVH